MAATSQASAVRDGALSEIWFTRCPVPTATGLAYKLGWLDAEFARDGIQVKTLQDAPQALARHHYDHRMPTLVREGGNLLALAARAQGEDTRLVGLTWIEDSQVILVRRDSGIATAADLAGKRLGLPTFTEHPIPEHVRGMSITRAMSLMGYKGALASAGLTFDDVELVEVNGTIGNVQGARLGDGPIQMWAYDALAKGKIDALYVKGASSLDDAYAAGLTVGINLDKLPHPHFRVNNGTPRPITVHRRFIDEHFDYLVRFFVQTLAAADWARENADDVRRIVAQETRGTDGAVIDGYGEAFHHSLQPELSSERIELLAQQKKALWLHGFLERDFDLAEWIDPRPLEEARRRLDAGLTLPAKANKGDFIGAGTADLST
ncbi:ABC transporter substrate-binding protein [Sphingobium phenoxybenzoativorans]|uniref:ABC transporter substrate-binding protein n=1 Tax=Sphingobium phenoxybenzoativorans TaxID=1592790 RepID=UPI000AF081D3|nr:ABC transporter substrate-binding protein [Sphingobium phenoxybenzoativorans]